MRRLPADVVFGMVVLALFGAVALLAPVLAPYDPRAFSGQPLERPSPAHPLGTNDVGHDILSELLYGARISLTVALAAGAGTALLGTLIGGAAGYIGGWPDRLLMRLVDMMMSLPRLPLIILLITFLGSGLFQTILVISLIFWPTTARVVRAQVQSIRTRGYIRMARLFGGGHLYIFLKHVLPSVAPLVAHGLVVSAGHAAVMEAGLAFLGLGDPTVKSWGLMIRFALNLPGIFLTDRWVWWALPPALCITLLIMGLTFLGIGMERSLHPRLSRRWERC
ncbi:MAG: ABC transporter permease [Anaerolineae bacterium]